MRIDLSPKLYRCESLKSHKVKYVFPAGLSSILEEITVYVPKKYNFTGKEAMVEISLIRDWKWRIPVNITVSSKGFLHTLQTLLL
jgi:hypothetical protein